MFSIFIATKRLLMQVCKPTHRGLFGRNMLNKPVYVQLGMRCWVSWLPHKTTPMEFQSAFLSFISRLGSCVFHDIWDSSDTSCLFLHFMGPFLLSLAGSLHVGDEILEINGQSVTNHSVDQLQKMLVGIAGYRSWGRALAMHAWCSYLMYFHSWVYHVNLKRNKFDPHL